MEAIQLARPLGIQKIVLGVPARCSVLPLTRGLRAHSQVVVLQDCPAVIAQRLRDDELDAALLPPVECLRKPGVEAVDEPPRFRIIPGIGVSSEGDSGTELLLSKVAINSLHHVAIDPAQGKMNALAQIVLSEHCRGRVQFMELGGDGAEGRIASGDDAFTPTSAFPIRHDLGALWHRISGLPFVHLVWIARRGAPLPELRRILALSLLEGLEALDEIAEESARTLGIDTDVARALFKETLQYRMASEEMDGLRAFIELARKHGFCEPGSEVVLC